MTRLVNYENWFNLREAKERETYNGFIHGDIISDILNDSSELSNLKSNKLLVANHSKVHYLETNPEINFYIKTDQLRKYLDLLYDEKVDVVPSYFGIDALVLSYVYSDRIKNNEFSVETWNLRPPSGYWGVYKSITIEYKCDTYKEFIRIISESFKKVVDEIFCKVIIMVEPGANKKTIPSDVVPIIKKNVKNEYKKIVHNYFYNAEMPDMENLPWSQIGKNIIDTKDISSIVEIDDIPSLKRIKNYIEQNTTDAYLLKLIKAFVRSKEILRNEQI